MIERLSKMLGEDSARIYPHNTEEKYPRIAGKIAALWGTAQMTKYFSELLFDDRGGRAGFPPEVMTELFRLSNYHETTKPVRAPNAAWDSGEVERVDRLGGFTKG